ncbi:MinD/ParA family protein [Streptomyces sp. NPDC091268]|uniref:MinD/ParA family ATP-binding protein n=1 Tax=Streptomyces sp. NPDC091268 TaxID=3365979 RepID=UPI00382D43D7
MDARGEQSGGTGGAAASGRPSPVYRLGGPEDPGWELAPVYGTVPRVAVPGGASGSASAAASGSASAPASAPGRGADAAGGETETGRPGRGPSPGRGRGRGGLRRLGGLLAPRDDPARLLTVRTAPLRGCHRIAVIGLQSGAGRTTTAAVLGSVLAGERADRVVLVDAGGAPGPLSRRVGPRAGAAAGGAVGEPSRPDTYAPESSGHFDDPAYRAAVDRLGRRYGLVVTDAGAGLSHTPLPGVLELAHQVVLVATPSVAGATGASAALAWLEEHGFREQARRCVTVVSAVREPGRALRPDELVAHFRTRCRGVVVVPYDEHLVADGPLDRAAVRRRTRAAHLELAALVAEGFTRPQ